MADGFCNQNVVVVEVKVELLRMHDYVQWLEGQSVVRASDLTELLGKEPEYAASKGSVELGECILTEP